MDKQTLIEAAIKRNKSFSKDYIRTVMEMYDTCPSPKEKELAKMRRATSSSGQ